MPKLTVSTFNGLTQAAGVSTNLIISTSSLPVIQNVFGYVNGNATPGATQYWLHLFNQATVPANGTVPLMSLQVLSSDGFYFDWTDLGLQTGNLTNLPGTGGWVLCLSSTEATLTIGTGAITMDCSVVYDSSVIPIPGLLKYGPSSTPTATIWTTAQGAAGTFSTLFSLRIQERVGADHYVYIFTDVTVQNHAIANGWQPIKLLANTTLELSFSRGFNPRGLNRSYVLSKGCYVYIEDSLITFDNSTIPPTMNNDSITTNAAYITAFYL